MIRCMREERKIATKTNGHLFSWPAGSHTLRRGATRWTKCAQVKKNFLAPQLPTSSGFAPRSLGQKWSARGEEFKPIVLRCEQIQDIFQNSNHDLKCILKMLEIQREITALEECLPKRKFSIDLHTSESGRSTRTNPEPTKDTVSHGLTSDAFRPLRIVRWTT